MKNKINLLFLLSISVAGLGLYWKRQQDKNREYHKKCLYLAVLDDAIARLDLTTFSNSDLVELDIQFLSWRMLPSIMPLIVLV